MKGVLVEKNVHGCDKFRAFQFTDQVLLDESHGMLAVLPKWVAAFLEAVLSARQGNCIRTCQGDININDWVIEDDFGSVHILTDKKFRERFRITNR